MLQLQILGINANPGQFGEQSARQELSQKSVNILYNDDEGRLGGVSARWFPPAGPTLCSSRTASQDSFPLSALLNHWGKHLSPKVRNSATHADTFSQDPLPLPHRTRHRFNKMMSRLRFNLVIMMAKVKVKAIYVGC